MNLTAASAYLTDRDPAMAQLILQLAPLKPAPPKGVFESLLGAIVSQQLSVKAAATIFGRFLHLLEMDLQPVRILATPAEEFRGVGLSGQKVSYVFALAEAFAKEPAAYNHLDQLSDEEVIAHLTKIKGIGVWTAQMFLMFTLFRPDVFPVGDLGIRKAMEKNLFDGNPQTHSILITRAEIWAPFRTVACFYLWKSLG